MLRDRMMAAVRTCKNTTRFINKLEWKTELLKFQILDDEQGRFDLKIECLDGYFLAHKMVFAALSEIKWSDKRNGLLETCVVMSTLEEVSKIMFLAYTGEFFFKGTPPYLDDLIKVFQIIQDKLSWGMPYYINGRSSHSLTLRKVRAYRKSVETGTIEDVYIYEDGSVIAVRETTTIEASENVLDIGHACNLCSCIFMEKIQLEEHQRNCLPLVGIKQEILSPPEANENVVDIGHACNRCSCIFMEKIQLEEHQRNCLPLALGIKQEILSPPEASANVVDIGHACNRCSCIFMGKIQLEEHQRNCLPLALGIKQEILSPPLSVQSEEVSESSTTAPSYQQECPTLTKLAISPEETVCSCGHKTNSDKKWAQHYDQTHDVKPTKDYSTRPFKKCKRCPFNQKGIPMSTFLHHVLNCKAAAEYNSLEFLDGSTFDPLLLQTPVDRRKGYNTPKRSNRIGKKLRPKEVNKKTSVNQNSSNGVSNVRNTNIGKVSSRQLLEDREMPVLEHYDSAPPEIIANKNVDASNQPLKKNARPIKKINFTQINTRASSKRLIDCQRDGCDLNVNTNQSKDGEEINEISAPKKKDNHIHPPDSASLDEPTINTEYSTLKQNATQVHPQWTSADEIIDSVIKRYMRPQIWNTPSTTTAPIIMTSNESVLQRTLKRKLSSSPDSESDTTTTKLIKLRPCDTPEKERLVLGKAFSPPSNLNRFPLGGHNKQRCWSCNYCKKQFDEQVAYMRHSCPIPIKSCPN